MIRLFLIFSTLMLLMLGVMALTLRPDKAERARQALVEQACIDAPTVTRIDGVERVLMHGPGEYSILKNVPGSSELVSEFLYCQQEGIKLIRDVPSDAGMWVERTKRADWPCGCKSAVIHIHAASDIGGGGWKKTMNKSTVRGQTEVIQ